MTPTVYIQLDSEGIPWYVSTNIKDLKVIVLDEREIYDESAVPFSEIESLYVDVTEADTKKFRELEEELENEWDNKLVQNGLLDVDEDDEDDDYEDDNDEDGDDEDDDDYEDDDDDYDNDDDEDDDEQEDWGSTEIPKLKLKI